MKIRVIDMALVAGLALCASALRAQTPVAGKILIGAGKTYVIDSAIDIERILISSPEVAESVPVSSRSVVINGKAPGETSAILWFSDGTRKQYEVSVSYSAARMDAAKQQIVNEFGDSVQLTGDANTVYLTGTVRNIFGSQRAQAIAGSFGKVVNLLKVELPPQEQEILIKVKFADVDRSKSLSLGANILGTPAGIPFNVTTGTSPSRFSTLGGGSLPTSVTLSDALNILMFDPHAKLLATIEALQAQNVLQILDEPNLTAMNGHTASFLAGGEYPYPTLQGGGSGVGQVTINYREFGIKLKVTPTLTPRGTIRMHIAPEVSSLDYANSLSVNGGTVPALTSRKIETDVEVEDGQSFAIAGLLDRSTTETLSKIPGLGDIPILGKFFSQKIISRNNSELIVIVTPQLVSPMHKDEPMPELQWPRTFLQGAGIPTVAPQTPGPDKTGPLPVRPVRSEISVQEMEKIQRDDQAQASGAQGGGSYGSEGGAGAGRTGAPVFALPGMASPGAGGTGTGNTQGPPQ